MHTMMDMPLLLASWNSALSSTPHCVLPASCPLTLTVTGLPFTPQRHQHCTKYPSRASRPRKEGRAGGQGLGRRIPAPPGPRPELRQHARAEGARAHQYAHTTHIRADGC